VLFRSPFFFLFIAQTMQFSGCLFFSAIDLKTNRIPKELMVKPAAMAVLGFAPFLVMWYTRILLVETELPTKAPTNGIFLLQFVLCGIAGDFFHYCAHRWLHSNKFLRHNVHSVHHNYNGPLYSWIGMEVHPLEVAIITAAIYTPFVLAAHPFVLWTFAMLATSNACCAHSGYHGGFAALRVLYALKSSDHELHHERNSTKNYGNILQFGTKSLVHIVKIQVTCAQYFTRIKFISL
jgi:sterol desaturase/sphingolipid hydroxylase (fatty acid hydroxylase superfamily)